MTMRRNHAMTLLEILISTALFATMLVLVFEAMANMRGLASTVEDMDILEEQAARAKRAISRDFANSGWFYCLPGANGRKYYPQIHLSDPQTWQKTIAPEPSFEIPLFNPLTAAIELTPFSASVTLNRASVLGDAIVFTRLQPEGQPHTNTPAAQGAAIVDMRNAQPMAMDQFANARPVQGLVINPTASDQPELTSVVWETTPAVLATTAGIKARDLYDDRKVRLFCYRVVPDPTTGRGQLIRYYSNPDSGDRNTDAAWQVDAVIADDVVGMRIYSFEMASWHSGTNTERDFTTNDAAGLTNNQIRFFIDFARNLGQVDADTAIDVSDRGGTTRSSNSHRASTVKTLEFTIGLRSITNALDQ
jgi:type II secretory pathway pseudopilin PulG